MSQADAERVAALLNDDQNEDARCSAGKLFNDARVTAGEARAIYHGRAPPMWVVMEDGAGIDAACLSPDWVDFGKGAYIYRDLIDPDNVGGPTWLSDDDPVHAFFRVPVWYKPTEDLLRLADLRLSSARERMSAQEVSSTANRETRGVQGA